MKIAFLNADVNYVLQTLLVNDPEDPVKYSGVRVSKLGYKTMVSRASRSTNKAKKLINEALDFVFTKDQLANMWDGS